MHAAAWFELLQAARESGTDRRPVRATAPRAPNEEVEYARMVSPCHPLVLEPAKRIFEALGVKATSRNT